jgi:hypothetical protein
LIRQREVSPEWDLRSLPGMERQEEENEEEDELEEE